MQKIVVRVEFVSMGDDDQVATHVTPFDNLLGLYEVVPIPP